MFDPNPPISRENEGLPPKRIQQKKDGYAPFLSTVPRIPEVKKAKTPVAIPPGPGSYDISRPMVRPVIETLRKSNNNIIIKINEVGSSAFKASERWKEPRDESPGPGQYKGQELMGQETEHHTIHNAMENYRQKFKAIFNKKPLETIPHHSGGKKIEKELKQKTAEVIKKRKQGGRGASWSKYVEQRFKQPTSDDGPGPGQYDSLEEHRLLNPSPSFISGSVRSFFDQIIFQTNQNAKAELRAYFNYKSNQPGPGTYEPDLERKTPEYKFQFFGSTQGRLDDASKQVETLKKDRKRSPALRNLAEKMLQEQSKTERMTVANHSLSLNASSLQTIDSQMVGRHAVRPVPPRKTSRKQIHMIFDKNDIL